MEGRQSPCFHRCFDDAGGAFVMGYLGGGTWYGIKWARATPKGIPKLYSFIGGMRRGGFKTGKGFLKWGGLFSLADCSLIRLRGKEDPINAIAAGAFTGFGLSLRNKGILRSTPNAIIGGALLALIEGLGFFMGRMSAPTPQAAAAPGTLTTGSMMMGGGMMPRLEGVVTMPPLRTLTPTLEPMRDELAVEAQLKAAEGKRRGTTADTPVFSPAPEFSSEDFSFSDDDDFEDDLSS